MSRAYEIIIPSASRPHLLEIALRSLLTAVDLAPRRLLVHDDAAFPGRQSLVGQVVGALATEAGVPYLFGMDDPPLYHGPALHWLLSRVETDFVLYSQDDLEAIRPLPIAQCLDVMAEHGLNQVRFNKRPTMGQKGAFRKVEVEIGGLPFCVADHWYFQTGLWRVSQIKPVVAWWATASGAFREHDHFKVNRTMNGQVPEFPPNPGVALPPPGADPMDPAVRHQYQRTYIWGRIGEDRFVRNLGHRPEDWALPRNRGGVGIRESFS